MEVTHLTLKQLTDAMNAGEISSVEATKATLAETETVVRALLWRRLVGT